MIYLDYSKAFDSLPYLRLIEKIKGYGIGGNLLLWLKNFLDSHLQRVLNGIQSQWSKVTSGIPQGPLLFVMILQKLFSVS